MDGMGRAFPLKPRVGNGQHGEHLFPGVVVWYHHFFGAVGVVFMAIRCYKHVIASINWDNPCI